MSPPRRFPRCPICRGWRFRAWGALLRCEVCSLTTDAPEGLAGSFAAARPRYGDSLWTAANAGDWRRRAGLRSGDAALLFTATALEMLANREERILRLRGGPWAAMSPRLAADLASPAPLARLSDALALAVICRPAELEAAADLAANLDGLIGEVLVAVDSRDPAEAPRFARAIRDAAGDGIATRVLVHPLDGDFAAQRNRLQAAASRRWTLHLDSDERPAPEMSAALPWLIADAEAKGRRILGFGRRNLVDGTMSAHYPDVQYRLTRADVRFVGRVHETPDAPPARWRERFQFVGGDILHFMTRERLARRSRLYESLQAGAGRPLDQTLLETPYDPFAVSLSDMAAAPA